MKNHKNSVGGVLAVLASIALGGQAFAQTAGAGSGSIAGSSSEAGANAGASAGASAGYTVNNYSDGTSTSNIVQSGTSTIKSAPAVQAPSVFGGGHPCLAGKSGGISVIGGGLSYGQGDAETVCMLWVIGQPEAAIRALVMTDPVACEALNGVGYYRVGNQVVPFQCGNKRVVGGIDTAGVASNTTRVSTSGSTTAPKSRPQLFTKCAMESGQVKIRYTSTGKANKEIANSSCLKTLGY